MRAMQAHHAAYKADTSSIFNRLLDHDDSDQKRGKESKLETGFQKTCALWNQAYGCPYPVDGTLYRQGCCHAAAFRGLIKAGRACCRDV